MSIYECLQYLYIWPAMSARQPIHQVLYWYYYRASLNVPILYHAPSTPRILFTSSLMLLPVFSTLVFNWSCTQSHSSSSAMANPPRAGFLGSLVLPNSFAGVFTLMGNRALRRAHLPDTCANRDSAAPRVSPRLGNYLLFRRPCYQSRVWMPMLRAHESAVLLHRARRSKDALKRQPKADISESRKRMFSGGE